MKNTTRTTLLALTLSALAATMSPAFANSSCSAWKETCESRCKAASCVCNDKQRACLKTGCWTEGAKSKGATHCGLTRK